MESRVDTWDISDQMNKVEVIPEVVRVLKLEGQAILDCAEQLQEAPLAVALSRALDLFWKSLEDGGKIVVTGVGKSGKIGQKIAATLCSTGSLSVFLHPTEGLHGDLGLIQSRDVIFALSYTGNTEELVRLIPSFKKLGVPIIGLGGNADSKLAIGCDVWLNAEVKNEACPYNLAPTTSTTLALALGDALAITLMQLRNFDSTAFARNHPGGSLGKRLNLTVGDLMQTGDAVAVVSPDASMEEVIVVSNLKKIGAVLVVRNNQLLGIITDGDIRRSLQLRESFFQLKAEDVMTEKPVTAEPSMMAQMALKLMEDRLSQISVLPIVDQQGIWKGVLRLHDLVKAF